MEENKTQPEKPDSVKVSKTSTGKYSFEIKLYFNREKEDYQDITNRMKDIETSLKTKFKEGKS